MADLMEHQFELDGVTFGIGSVDDVTVEDGGFDTGSAAYRSQDYDNPGEDGRSFARDFISPPTWAFTMSTDTVDEHTALAALARLRRAWRGDKVRLDPREVLALRYRLDGRERVVYGRPRRWSAPPSNRILGGYVPITADFVLADDLHYDADESAFEITATASATGGLKTPLVTPLTTALSSVPKVSSITVAGDADTWPIVDFEGPVTNPYLILGDVRIDLVGSIPDGETVRLDARPWMRTTTFASGGSAAGRLARRTRLSNLRLSPGTYAVTFGGIDPTGSARATVRWRAAHTSL